MRSPTQHSTLSGRARLRGGWRRYFNGGMAGIFVGTSDHSGRGRWDSYPVNGRAGVLALARMRASCATDGAEALPAHVVAKWLGHSPLVAAKHYLQTRDAHFEVALSGRARVGLRSSIAAC